MAKKRFSQAEAEQMMPAVKEFNGLAKQLLRLLGMKADQKEKKISIMVSRISRPKGKDHQINVRTVDIGKGFFDRKKDKKRPGRSSDYDDEFRNRKGYII